MPPDDEPKFIWAERSVFFDALSAQVQDRFSAGDYEGAAAAITEAQATPFPSKIDAETCAIRIMIALGLPQLTSQLELMRPELAKFETGFLVVERPDAWYFRFYLVNPESGEPMWV
jgi:hypothetical protein